MPRKPAAPKTKKPTGRPSLYNEEVAAIICARLAEGESLRHICKDAGMPSMYTVFKWLGDGKHESFNNQYACAREAQADSYADEIVDIADEEADPAKARVRVDARKWVACKLKPKKYGDKISTELTGKDGAPLQPAQVIVYALPDNGRDGTGGNGDDVE